MDGLLRTILTRLSSISGQPFALTKLESSHQSKEGPLPDAYLRLMPQSPCYVAAENSIEAVVSASRDGLGAHAQKCTVGDIDDGIACLRRWLAHSGYRRKCCT